MTSADPIRVLHVEDDQDFAEVVAIFLERENELLTVDTTTSVSDALEHIASHEFSCIVSDYDMPEMNGLELLRAVRETHPSIPFILFTGKGSEEIASEAISAGVTDYMQKGRGTDQYTVLANRIQNAVSRHRAELEIKQTKEHFQTLVEDATDAILVVSPNGTVQYATPTAEQVLGRTPAELVGTDVFASLPAEEQHRLRDSLADLEAEPRGRRTIEFHYEAEDGTEIWVEARARNLLDNPTIEGIVLYAREISDRKQRQRELREYRHRLEGAMLAGGIAWWELDVPTGGVTFNAGKASMLGYDPDRFSHFEDFTELLHPADFDRTMQAMHDHLDGSAEKYDVRYRIEASDGEYHWYHDVGGVTEHDDSGAPLTVTGVVVDITAHEAHKELIEEEQRRFQAVFEKAFDAMIIADDDGTYVNVNPAASELFGVPRAELIGQSAAAFAIEDYDVRDAWAAFRAKHRDRGVFPLRRPTGEVRLTEYAATRDIVPGEHLSILRDVTSRVAGEAELLRQNERLEEFVGVISHDLKAPLSIIHGRLDLAEETGEPEQFERSRREIERVSTMISDLQALARAGQAIGRTEPVELSTVARDAWGSVLSDGVALEVTTDQTITGDAGRVRQLLVNLFQNAVEEPETTTVTIGSLDDGFYIEDDGSGIPEADRGEIFETGFSTKSRGSGFGLNIVKEVVKAHGWEIRATEGQHGGARFEITAVSAGDE